MNGREILRLLRGEAKILRVTVGGSVVWSATGNRVQQACLVEVLDTTTGIGSTITLQASSSMVVHLFDGIGNLVAVESRLIFQEEQQEIDAFYSRVVDGVRDNPALKNVVFSVLFSQNGTPVKSVTMGRQQRLWGEG